VQRVRESKVESAEIVSAESVSTVREHSGESKEYRECEGTVARGGNTVHDESTVREYRESAESARMKNVLQCRKRECRVDSAESARMQRRERNLRVQSRECRECENEECVTMQKTRVQRVRECRDESAI
jgi:hypothetical protein